MLNQPQETTSCSFNKIDTIVRDLEHYYLSSENSQLVSLQNALGHPVWMLVAGSGCRAKPFGYPIRVEFNGIPSYVVDARSVTSATSSSGAKITNHADYELLTELGVMTSIWDSPDKRLVSNIAVNLSPIFATWISSTVSAAFNLQVDQRTEITILAAYYYWQLLDIEDNPDRIASRIAIDLKLEFDRVIGVIENFGTMTNIMGLIEGMKASSAGVRLEKLDAAALYQVSSGVWTGPLGRTTMEIAFEFPPYIVALTHSALIDKSYRRTRFMDYVSLFDRRTEIKQLPETVIHLFRKH